jgi:hypothetical protein
VRRFIRDTSLSPLSLLERIQRSSPVGHKATATNLSPTGTRLSKSRKKSLSCIGLVCLAAEGYQTLNIFSAGLTIFSSGGIDVLLSSPDQLPSDFWRALSVRTLLPIDMYQNARGTSM